MDPLVSVIIPAYNKAQLTVKTVESVLAQTYKNLEILVADDGSADDTRLQLERFGDKIRYLYKENGGACSARNFGLKHSRGEYVAFLDCDDLYLPKKIEASVKYLQSNPQVGFVHTAAYFVDGNDQVLTQYSHPKSRKTGWISRELCLRNYICNSTVLMRKECFNKAGDFDETIFPPADWDLWLRLSEHYEAGYIDEPLTKYRVTDNYTFKHLERSKADERKVLEKFFARNPRWIDLQGKVWSQFHLRYAQCYFLKEELPAFHHELALAFKADPWNLKVYAIWAGVSFAPNNLKSYLRKKIMRCPSDPKKLNLCPSA